MDYVINSKRPVVATDLFPFANQRYRQKRVGHSLTNQLAERINSFFLSRTIFSSPFFLCVDGQRAMSQQYKQISLTSLLLIPFGTHH